MKKIVSYLSEASELSDYFAQFREAVNKAIESNFRRQFPMVRVKNLTVRPEKQRDVVTLKKGKSIPVGGELGIDVSGAVGKPTEELSLPIEVVFSNGEKSITKNFTIGLNHGRFRGSNRKVFYYDFSVTRVGDLNG